MIKTQANGNMNISAAHIKWKMLQIMANASTTLKYLKCTQHGKLLISSKQP